MGGLLNGKPIMRWTTIAEHIHEHNKDIKVLTSKSSFLSNAVLGDLIKSIPGIDTPSASKPKAPSSMGNTIYYTLTKIIFEHIIFPTLKSCSL